MVRRASGAVFRPYATRLLIWRLLLRLGLGARKRRKKAQNRILAVQTRQAADGAAGVRAG